MKIAIVEDDINMRKALEISLGDFDEFEVFAFKDGVSALKSIDDSFDLIITDINMPKLNGLEFIQKCNEKGSFEYIIITGNASLSYAIEGLRMGVKDFLTKPFETSELVNAIKRANNYNKKIKQNPKKTTIKNDDFLGSSKSLETAKNIALKAAKTKASVMLMGQSGAGKEVFANFIHKNSSDLNAPFIAINMAAIPANLLESELFGYEKGAFTDASATKIGLFELANGGTLFLDEIAEMPYELQAKLLRVLQEKTLTRLGGKTPIKVDLRVISATNANLGKMIEEKKFREDLYYRLNTIIINIPPLKERKDEIKDIAEATLKRVCAEYGFGDKTFSNDALKSLLEYDYPGNIRELISIVERAAILSEGDMLKPEDLFLQIKPKDISSMEKELIEEVLKECENDYKKSATMLGMSENKLKDKIEKYGLKI